jgi:hypothetical protein
MSPESVQRFRDKDMRKIKKPTAWRVNPVSRDVLEPVDPALLKGIACTKINRASI